MCLHIHHTRYITCTSVHHMATQLPHDHPALEVLCRLQIQPSTDSETDAHMQSQPPPRPAEHCRPNALQLENCLQLFSWRYIFLQSEPEQSRISRTGLAPALLGTGAGWRLAKVAWKKPHTSWLPPVSCAGPPVAFTASQKGAKKSKHIFSRLTQFIPLVGYFETLHTTKSWKPGLWEVLFKLVYARLKEEDGTPGQSPVCVGTHLSTLVDLPWGLPPMDFRA